MRAAPAGFIDSLAVPGTLRCELVVHARLTGLGCPEGNMPKDLDLVERAGDLEDELEEVLGVCWRFFRTGDAGVPNPPGGNWLICSSKESSLPNPSDPPICWSLATAGGRRAFDSLLDLNVVAFLSLSTLTNSCLTRLVASSFMTGSSTI